MATLWDTTTVYIQNKTVRGIINCTKELSAYEKIYLKEDLLSAVLLDTEVENSTSEFKQLVKFLKRLKSLYQSTAGEQWFQYLVKDIDTFVYPTGSTVVEPVQSKILKILDKLTTEDDDSSSEESCGKRKRRGRKRKHFSNPPPNPVQAPTHNEIHISNVINGLTTKEDSFPKPKGQKKRVKGCKKVNPQKLEKPKQIPKILKSEEYRKTKLAQAKQGKICAAEARKLKVETLPDDHPEVEKLRHFKSLFDAVKAREDPRNDVVSVETPPTKAEE
ncbi:ORF1 [Leptomonas seymouri Narna-like virus 1]|uniref:ORF1 n=1 Tax=Leptomonas Narna-like virus 1 TaxID=2041416 RepID=A0A291LQY5_9VIRU|nr:ORF1 [Leptomonas seymouri Narna-like virus 1]ANI86035.1 ORF1 [Leptomonas seymouri Narna-like virus 1]ATI23584.1 ORF1 [Leptomonas Narna-like virus 1]